MINRANVHGWHPFGVVSSSLNRFPGFGVKIVVVTC